MPNKEFDDMFTEIIMYDKWRKVSTFLKQDIEIILPEKERYMGSTYECVRFTKIFSKLFAERTTNTENTKVLLGRTIGDD